MTQIAKKKHISVFLEINNGVVEPVSLQILAKANELAETSGLRLSAVAVADNFTPKMADFLPFSPETLFIIKFKNSTLYNEKLYSDTISSFIMDENVSIFLAGATTLGRSLMPLCAAKLGAALTADCTELEIDSGLLIGTRPTFGGNLMAQIIAPKSRVQMATVRPNIFPLPEKRVSTAKENIVERIFNYNDTIYIPRVVKSVIEEREDIGDAEIIVAGGRGIGSKENFSLLYDFAEKIGGRVAGSRAVVDAGWLPHSLQIGQTGKTVTPKIYIAIGISGAVQHLAGMSGAKKIVAINNDPNADIFKIATYGIVSDYKEVLSSIIKTI